MGAFGGYVPPSKGGNKPDKNPYEDEMNAFGLTRDEAKALSRS
jgi:hypothetical protein